MVSCVSHLCAVLILKKNPFCKTCILGGKYTIYDMIATELPVNRTDLIGRKPFHSKAC